MSCHLPFEFLPQIFTKRQLIPINIIALRFRQLVEEVRQHEL